MEYALEHKQIMNIDSNILYHLNFIRIKKEIYLPCELVSIDRSTKTLYFANISQKILIYQNISKTIEKPTKKNQENIQNRLIEWISNRRIVTDIDFNNISQKQKITKRIL